MRTETDRVLISGRLYDALGLRVWQALHAENPDVVPGPDCTRTSRNARLPAGRSTPP